MNGTVQETNPSQPNTQGIGNGQVKCPKCGATDISLNVKTGKLRCNYCRHEFESQKVEQQQDLSQLSGQSMTQGVQNIQADASNMITLKCSSCGAEVVIDTSETLHARCHWCRNTLSVNDQIPNGAVPDVVLPFHITKEEAEQLIRAFVSKRKFYAHPIFKKEFTTENIMGVYFPYMIVDVNSHANFKGEGEHLIRRYTIGDDEHRETYYDADVYHVEREFDLTIDNLTVESNKDRLNHQNDQKTNNIINAIMPFDIENCVKFQANFLKGFTSEKRDVNVDDVRNLVALQSRDIARFAANESLKQYDRGVCWQTQDLQIIGQSWQAAYLPVWLYSYQQKKGNKSIIHYVAVNARTKETMGSIPIYTGKLLLVSFLIEVLCFFAIFYVDFEGEFLMVIPGIAYYCIMYARYRNKNARHHYELETKKEINNLRKVDQFLKRRTGLSNPRIQGQNNTSVQGTLAKNDTWNKISQNLMK